MRRALVIFALLLASGTYHARIASQAASGVTSPLQHFGARIGDDYFLATYTQLEQYWQKVDAESDRVQVVPIGRTEEGRTQWMAIVSAPENLARVDRYRDISRRLARAEGVSEDEARVLAEEGKAVVWIDGGLHADEVLGAQQLIETVYQLASATDAETLRVLRDVIVLAVHANPDGHALVAEWYMRERDPQQRTLAGLPRAYQKYVGHDNNRDFYLSSQAETINMNRVLYREWFPQIVYDHHQSAPDGTVMFAPPFSGPFNSSFDPLVLSGIDLLGGAMHARFAAEGKAGVTMRGGSSYSTWWNGGLRTTAYFHNQIGLLTETFGSPTPTEIPRVPARQVAGPDLPAPIAPQRWHFRQAVSYSLSANRAVLDVASRHRPALLFNAWQMGRNSIEQGSRDTWPASVGVDAGARRPELRVPRGYILPSNQPDFLTATKFANALLKAGVAVHRATRSFEAAGRSYPAGSLIVKTAQAFRPHVLDMFEPQYAEEAVRAAPAAPYDITGWTLALQMGVEFDRVLDAFDGPFEAIEEAVPPPGAVNGPAGAVGYLLPHNQNDAAVAVNRLLSRGERVYWLRDRHIAGGGTGAVFIAATPAARPVAAKAAAELGLVFAGVATVPAGPAWRLDAPRVGLWDRYGGSSTSGWIRWILERYEFPHERVYAPQLDAGRLADRFDVLILPDEAVPGARTPTPEAVPVEYRHTAGAISWSRTVPRLAEFVEDGGTLILIGDATTMGEAVGAAVSIVPGGGSRPGGPAKDAVFIPGSILRANVDNTVPIAYGLEGEVDVMFHDSPFFRVPSGSRARRAAWFSSAPLRSGWAWGQHHLDDAAAVVEAPVGRGRVILFGPEIVFRGQPHGTFKFLFNAIHSSRMQPIGRAE